VTRTYLQAAAEAAELRASLASLRDMAADWAQQRADDGGLGWYAAADIARRCDQMLAQSEARAAQRLERQPPVAGLGLEHRKRRLYAAFL